MVQFSAIGGSDDRCAAFFCLSRETCVVDSIDDSVRTVLETSQTQQKDGPLSPLHLPISTPILSLGRSLKRHLCRIGLPTYHRR